MPAGVDMTWRGVRPLLPGVVNRLSGPAATAPAATTVQTFARPPAARRHHTLIRLSPSQAQCVFCRPQRTRTVAARPLLFCYSTAADSDSSCNNSNNDSKSSSTDTGHIKEARPSPTVVSWQAMAKDVEDKRRRETEDRLRQQQQSSVSSSRTTTPGTRMMDRMSRNPPLPLPIPPAPSPSSSTPSSASTTATPPLGQDKYSPSAASVFTKPIIHHIPLHENELSRKQHVKSVVRQGRLEIMRQMQGLHMVDWREVLRRLAMSTPREESYEQVPEAAAAETVFTANDHALADPALREADGPPDFDVQTAHSAESPAKLVGWRQHAVLFAFPADSPSVTELMHGVDDSMWSIWSRTTCVLKLFRWRGSSASSSGSLNFANRPWLLSISGASEMAISRAVMDVVRFAKDAESITLSPSDLAFLDDSLTRATTAQSSDNTNETTASQAAPEKAAPEGGPWKLELSSHYYDSKYCEDPVFQPHVTVIGAHEIPRPDVWTPDSFERYVAALVNGAPPPQLGTKIYHEQRARDCAMEHSPYGTEAVNRGAGDANRISSSRQQPIAPSHSLAVIGLLHNVFHDEAARSSVTLSAFKMALRYICRYGEANRPDMRTLFTRIEGLGIPMDTETFNIILASYAQSQDLRNYGSTLRLMRSRHHGYTPDLTTWLLFLRLFWSEDVKRHILNTMFAKGLLNTSRAVQLVALEMAEHDAQQAILRASKSPSQGTSFMHDFMAGQAQRYGPRWLSRVAANRILNVFASHARFAECDQLLAALQAKQDAAIPRPKRPKSEMQRARARARQKWADAAAGVDRTNTAANPPPGFVSRLSLDIFTYNVVMTHCKVQDDLDAALMVLRRMEVAGAPKVPDGLTSYVVGRSWLPRIPPDSATYHLLFAIAWSQRLPHVMAVVWHYACVNLQARHWILLRASRERVELANGKQVPLAFYLTGIGVGLKRTKKRRGVVPPCSVSGHRPVQQAGLEMSTRIAYQYRRWVPAEPLSKVLQDAIDRDAAMRAADHATASSKPPPPMRVLLRKRAMEKEDEIMRWRRTEFQYMEIPVKWGAFKTIGYSR